MLNKQDGKTAMNKITRASIVGIAGLGLLAGGATFAVWSSDAEIPGATINSGTLTLSDMAGEWTDTTGATPVPIDNIAEYEVVPGSQLSYTGTTTITASGDNLVAELGYTDAELTADSDDALADAVEVNATFALSDEGDVENITSADNGDVVTVTVTVDVSPTLADEVAQGEAITLANGGVTLTQVNPRVTETVE